MTSKHATFNLIMSSNCNNFPKFFDVLYPSTSQEIKRRLNLIRDNTSKMNSLIDDLLALSRIYRTELTRSRVDMTGLAKSAWKGLVDANPETKAAISIGNLPEAMGNENLLLQVFTNLLSNAAKYTRKRRKALIEVGGEIKGEENVYYIKDNGAGFNMKYSDKLFGVFQRLHAESEYEGTGVGLAIVQRIIHPRRPGLGGRQGRQRGCLLFHATE